MTAVLSIKGEKYHSIAEVETAIRKLAADMSLMAEDAEGRDDVATHIGELLAAIPDENANALLNYIAGTNGVEPSDSPALHEGAAASDVEDGSAAPGANGAPTCPMCLGEGVLGAEPPQDPTAQRCPACDGYGTVYTGSRVEGHTTRHCPTCMGNGYVGKTSDIPLPPQPQRAASAAKWPGSFWNPTASVWEQPNGNPPWEGATWDGIEGTYK